MKIEFRQKLFSKDQSIYILQMEEGCLLSLLSRKEPNQLKQMRSRRISQGLHFPIYILTTSYQSKHLSSLQQLLENQHIALAFQKQLTFLQKIPNTYQESFFIVLNGYDNAPSLEGQFKNIKYQTTPYPQTQGTVLLKRYWQFVARQLKNSEIDSGGGSKQGMGVDEVVENEWGEEESEGKSKVKLKSVSKLLFNYKSVWPKKLFVYSNRRDDQSYQAYVLRLKAMTFDNAVFIDQIEDYIRELPQKQDVSFCVLMSQYTAINLRKFFKKTDEILLLGQDKEQCLPLVRGKVTYFTTEPQSINLILVKKFGMKPKSLPHLSLQKIEGDAIVEPIRQSSPVVNSNLEASSTKFKEEKTCSSSNLKIIQQYSLMNEPVKQLLLLSNLINLSISPSKSQDVKVEQVKADKQAQTPTKEKKPCKKKEEILYEFTKISPLRVVQLETVSIANTSIRSSEIAERQVFEEIFDKINFGDLEFKTEQRSSLSASKNSDQRESSRSQKENMSEFGGSSHSSRFSAQNSLNSRIISRIQQCGRFKKKVLSDAVEPQN